MDAAFWLDRWENGQIGFHGSEVHEALRTHWSALGAPAGTPVLVPLCGKSLDMAWLRGQGHPVVGVELSPVAVREFFAEHGLTPSVSTSGAFERWSAGGITILRGDVFDLTPDDVAACRSLYDRAALVALPPALRERYARHLSAILPASARMLLVTLRYPPTEMQGPPFSVDEAEVRRLYGDGWRIARVASADVLARDANLRARGPSALAEETYTLWRGEP